MAGTAHWLHYALQHTSVYPQKLLGPTLLQSQQKIEGKVKKWQDLNQTVELLKVDIDAGEGGRAGLGEI